jgi:hypothetical protein
MKESEFIKLNFKFEFSNSCANVKVKITSLRTAVRQLANTLTVREFSKWIVSDISSLLLSCDKRFLLYVSLFRYHFADNLLFYAHFRYFFLLGFLVPAYVVLYLLLFVAQVRLNYPVL